MSSEASLCSRPETLDERRPIEIYFESFKYCQTYDEFAVALYGILDEIILLLEEDGDILYDSKKIEDGISRNICKMFTVVGVEARPQAVNGNTDITVRHHRLGFKWICEAKVLKPSNGNTYLYSGMQQQATRYSVGRGRNEKHGGLIVYCLKDRTDKQIASWKQYFLSNACSKDFDQLKECEFSNMDHGFYTSHLHRKSGNEFVTRHTFVTLSYDPSDRD